MSTLAPGKGVAEEAKYRINDQCEADDGHGFAQHGAR